MNIQAFTLLLVICATASLSAQISNDEKTLDSVEDYSATATPLEGLWMRDLPNNIRGLKQFFKGRVWVSYVNTKTGITDQFMTGIYSFDGKILREKMKFGTEKWAGLLNKLVIFKVAMEGTSIYSQTNPDGGKEVWTRADP